MLHAIRKSRIEMRILIDMQGAQSESRFRGIGRYTHSLVKEIVRNRGEHEIILVLSSLFPEEISSIRDEFHDSLPQEKIHIWHGIGPTLEADPSNTIRRQVSEYMREAAIAAMQPDVILITSLVEGLGDDAVTSVAYLDKETPTVSILYDLIPLISPDEHFKSNPIHIAYYQRKIAALRNCTALLAISESARSEALEALNCPGDRVINISSGCDPRFRPMPLSQTERKALLEKFGIVRPFVMYTGGADERKNLNRLIEAFASLPISTRTSHQLVLVGRMHSVHVAQYMANGKRVGLSPDELLFTGYVSDEELMQLYTACQLFVFPSLHEGFGLPPLEAMACGAPAIAANATSLPEVIGCNDALFDPLSVSSIAEKMQQVLSDNSFRSELVRFGAERVKLFSWDESARRAIAVLEKVAKPSVSLLNDHSQRIYVAESGVKDGAGIPFIEAIKEKLISSITPLISSLSENELFRVADAIARNLPERTQKRLFIDISELITSDARTGIQRVVRSILKHILEDDDLLYEIVPVYATVHQHGYRVASRFLSTFSEAGRTDILDDEPIDYQAGDIFLGLDLQTIVVPIQKDYLKHLRNEGVTVYFVVYDILCMRLRGCFRHGVPESFENWLPVVADSDGAICISKSVAEDLELWLKDNGLLREKRFEIKWFHIGADIDASVPSLGKPDGSDVILSEIRRHTSFLMVGTLEPRKGYTDVLDAFDLLWADGRNLMLVIVGKRGWKAEQLIKRIQMHHEYERRLIWLEAISDEYLEEVYASVDCLIAASIGEGFGLPLIEAAQHRVPIIARDLKVFREVAGSHAFYFKDSNAEELSRDILDWLALFQNGKHPDSITMPFLTWKQSTKQLLACIGDTDMSRFYKLPESAQ